MEYNKYYYNCFDLVLDRARYNLLTNKRNCIRKPWEGFLNTTQDQWSWHILDTLSTTPSTWDNNFYIRCNCNRVTTNLEDSKILYNSSVDNSYAVKFITNYIKRIYSLRGRILANLVNKPKPKQVTQPIYWVSQFSLRDSSSEYWLSNNDRLILNGYSKPVPVVLEDKTNQLQTVLDPKENKINGEEIYYLAKEDTYGRVPTNSSIYKCKGGYDTEYLIIDDKNNICKSYLDNSVDVFDNYEGALENLKERIFTEFDRVENHYIELLNEIESFKYQGTSKPSKLLSLIEI